MHPFKHTDMDQYSDSDNNENSLCAVFFFLVSLFHVDPLGDSYYVAF